MRFKISLFAFLLVAGSLALPLAAHAGVPFFGPIIPNEAVTVNGVATNQNVCAAGWGAVLTVINNIISLLITLAIVFVAPIMIAYSGFLFVVNPVNSSGISEAKKILTNTVVGIVIVLAGYMIVAAIMAALYNPSAESGKTKLGVWTDIVGSRGEPFCLPQRGSVRPTVTPPPTVVVPTTACSSCVPVTGVLYKPPPSGCDLDGGQMGIAPPNPQISTCQINSSLLAKLQTANRNIQGIWEITEMWPPTITHSASCHANGTCVDVASRGASPPSMAKAFIDAGLYPVYEFNGTAQACATLLQQFNNAGTGNIQILKLNVLPHFSIYTDRQRIGGCVGF